MVNGFSGSIWLLLNGSNHADWLSAHSTTLSILKHWSILCSSNC